LILIKRSQFSSFYFSAESSAAASGAFDFLGAAAPAASPEPQNGEGELKKNKDKTTNSFKKNTVFDLHEIKRLIITENSF